MKTVIYFIHDQEGATAIEYWLVVALIAVVVIGAMQSTGTTVSMLFGNIP